MAERPKAYSDPYWSELSARAEQKVGLPAGLLDAIVNHGERTNADRVSSAGARTVYQIIPETAKGLRNNYGIDPYLSDENAAIGAATLLKANLDKYNNSVPMAVAAYHGGYDKSAWGPITNQYVRRVMNGLNQQPTQEARVIPANATSQDDVFKNIMNQLGEEPLQQEQPKQNKNAPANQEDIFNNIMQQLGQGNAEQDPYNRVPAPKDRVYSQQFADDYASGKLSPQERQRVADVIAQGAKVPVPTQGVIQGFGSLVDKATNPEQYAQDQARYAQQFGGQYLTQPLGNDYFDKYYPTPEEKVAREVRASAIGDIEGAASAASGLLSVPAMAIGALGGGAAGLVTGELEANAKQLPQKDAGALIRNSVVQGAITGARTLGEPLQYEPRTGAGVQARNDIFNTLDAFPGAGAFSSEMRAAGAAR